MSNKDEEFLRHLRGEQVSTPNPLMKDSAQLIRDLLDHPVHYQAPSLSEDKLAAFQARLAQIRVPIATPRASKNSKWIRGWAIALPLSACLLIGVSLLRPASDDQASSIALPPADQWRSTEDSAIVSVTNPLGSAQNTLRKLSELNIEAHISTREEVVFIEAFVPEQKQEAVNRLLRPYHQQVGNNGELRFGFKRP